MFRITKTKSENNTVLRLVGHLSADHVAVLEHACRNVKGPLRLDLSDLRHADDSGLAAIQEIVGRGAEVIHSTPYTVLLLGNDESREPGC